jgi:cytochrome c oxidase subunit II
MFGTTGMTGEGEEFTRDEDYILESILKPQAKLVDGYAGLMQSFEGQLNQQELEALIEYVKNK